MIEELGDTRLCFSLLPQGKRRRGSRGKREKKKKRGGGWDGRGA